MATSIRSAHIRDDQAAATLLANLDGRALAEPRVLKFTTGRRRRMWSRNCVALGLASGFLEPLESTSIYLIQSGIARLIHMLPDRHMSTTLQDRYNAEAAFEIERIRDFLILHYHATQRRDSEFWNYCAHMSIPAELDEKMRLFRDSGRFYRNADEMFALTSWVQVMIGQHIVPTAYHPLVDAVPDAGARTTRRERARCDRRVCCRDAASTKNSSRAAARRRRRRDVATQDHASHGRHGAVRLGRRITRRLQDATSEDRSGDGARAPRGAGEDARSAARRRAEAHFQFLLGHRRARDRPDARPLAQAAVLQHRRRRALRSTRTPSAWSAAM